MGASDPFEPIPMFAYPLWSTMVPGHDQQNPVLLEEILAHRDRHAGSVRSNRNGWHSGEEFMQVRSAALGWLMQNVARFARQALAPYYDDFAHHELRLGSYWANVLGRGGFNAPHHHLPQHWSGCYYVSAAGVVADAANMAGWIEFVNPNPTQSQWGSGNFGYAPRAGTMLLFPSSLTHYVHPHDSDEVRVSIAFNLNVVAKAG
jgi:uncharacterized protein (TIGR02466 family)